MILVASQRGGAGQLARHLMNMVENDHVTVQELRGFVADDLQGAFNEAHAVSKATQCKQFLFSLSLNPPKDAEIDLDGFREAAERAEAALGLEGQPRAIVVHEKNGRRHAHVVWSRIDANEMKAINLPHFKNRLNALARELYLEHGWTLPDGLKTNGWKNPLNFTLDEWQQAKRLDLDPREIKAVFREAWEQSDNLSSFKAALEEHGFYLARGDRRGVVALDLQGEVYSVARWAGVRTRDLNQRLAGAENLPGLADVNAANRGKLNKSIQERIAESREQQKKAIEPLLEQRRRMVKSQRVARARLQERQSMRATLEQKQRAERFRKGLWGLWDVLTGKVRKVRLANEQEVKSAHKRDLLEREGLFKSQREERRALQKPYEALRHRQKEERLHLVRMMSRALHENALNKQERVQGEPRQAPRRDRDFDLEM